MTTESKEIKQIKTALSSSNKEQVLEGIKLSRAHANRQTFGLMLKSLKDTDEPEVEAAIIQFLYDLKDESSVEPLIEALKNDDMTYYHSFIIAAFWQSAIDGSAYLDVFVEKAIKGDSSFPSDLLMDLDADLTEAIESEESEEKKNLLISLKEVVGNLPVEGE